MPKHLPYRVKHSFGGVLDIDFPLHAQTASAVRVSQLLSATLACIDHELRILGETANGDVLQALAMALAVRAGMIEAPRDLTDTLAGDLVRSALSAVPKSPAYRGPVGHA